MAIEALARAKVNLALHVTGQRADGYHLLDSIVAFADHGDRITVEHAAALSLTLTGPFANGLSSTDNLVLRAARALGPDRGAHITLQKNLPVASGIGGGSADAAATLHALSQLWSAPLPPPGSLLTLGADLPVCLAGHPARMQGIGDLITPLPLPPAWLVLANPGVALPTAQVFRALHDRNQPGLAPPPPLNNTAALVLYLQTTRNDLEPPARALVPDISDTIAALGRQPGCLLARMSGSGATCFGLFTSQAEAQTAARSLQTAHPEWWAIAAALT